MNLILAAVFTHSINGTYDLPDGIVCVDFEYLENPQYIGTALAWPSDVTADEADLACLRAEVEQGN